MPVIDKYNIPFPYSPYPLQEHAVNELRSFLELENEEHYNQGSNPKSEKLTQNKDLNLSRKPKWKVAVLESPTGTGKSQILLNSVLSYFFELYGPESQSLHRNVIDNIASDGSNEYSCNRKCIEIDNTKSKMEKENLLLVKPIAASTTTHREMTLEEAIMREREREKAEREKREMRRQIRKRKRAQLAECKRKQNRIQQQKQTIYYEHIDKESHDNDNKHNNDNNVDDFLIAQDRECDDGDSEQNVETEQKEVWSDKMQSTHSVLTRSISSSSETEYSSSDSECDERELLHEHTCKGNLTSLSEQHELDTFNTLRYDEINLQEEEEEYESRSDADLDDDLSLSRLVALRKPKVYFASRTHTQLEQLFHDLQITDFAKQHIMRRKQSKERIDESKHGFRCCNNNDDVDNDNNCVLNKDENIDQVKVNRVKETQSTTRSTADVHYLNAIHVAGRQHLCINAAIRQRAANNNSTLLNELCTEAMKYERSPEGRRARHVQNTEHSPKNIIKSTYQPSPSSLSSCTAQTAAAKVIIPPLSCTNQSTCNNLKPKSDMNINKDAKRNYASAQNTQLQEEEQLQNAQNIFSPLEDVEDSGSVFWQEAHNNTHTLPKGCEFCALHRIRALVEYVRRQHRKGQFISMQEMIKLGQELRACPYLATQVLIRGADVVFIPYSYLVDEEQRERLLGGCSTNPISVSEMRSLQTTLELETETLTQSLRENSKTSETMYEGYNVQRHHFHRPSRYSYHHHCSNTTTNNNKDKYNNCYNRSGQIINEEDALIEEHAVNAPASLHGDVVVIDEAHNIADYCRSVSTSQITTLHLMLVHTVLHKYERVYQRKLLSRNKQRIREMLALIDKLLQFAKHNETPSLSSSSSSLESQRQHTQETSHCNKSNVHVFEFNNWLFDAKIDYIDVYPFLSFLSKSMLLSKLRGFVGSVLHKEFDHLINYNLKERERNALQRLNERKKLKTKGVTKEYVVHGTVSSSSENKFAKNNNNLCSSYTESELLIRELCTLHHDNWQEYINMCSCDTSSNNYDKSENVNINALVSWHVQNVSRALQQFVHFLRWLYKSNSSTRVLVETNTTQTSALSSVGVKLIQLEPGQHTLASLIHQASATILAGGTMEPLLLTVSSLLPELEWNALPTTQQRECQLLISPIQSSAHNVSVQARTHINNNNDDEVALDYVYLIKEGHIVPSSSVVVYTLSTGPSNTKLCFSHQSVAKELNSTESSPSSSVSSSSTCALFKELAMTLLNFARVLPHAGVICFFTSHEMEARFVKYLQSTKFYDEINEVKRIFSVYTFMATHVVKNNQNQFTNRMLSGTQISISNHCQSSSLTHSTKESTDVLTNMLVEYKRWIYNVASEIDCLDDKSVCITNHSDNCNDNDKQKIAHATRGAFLFTVMGGKLSEGINFADDLARAVLVIGLPFANAQDVELQLHLKHLAQKQLKQDINTIQNLALPHPMPSLALTTKSVFTTQAEWNLYNDLCMRVVNQCIGRCIRHINDYAAIVLVDCRYGERITLQRKLATWLQPSLHVTSTFGECFRGLRAFFDNIAKTEADKIIL